MGSGVRSADDNREHSVDAISGTCGKCTALTDNGSERAPSSRTHKGRARKTRDQHRRKPETSDTGDARERRSAARPANPRAGRATRSATRIGRSPWTTATKMRSDQEVARGAPGNGGAPQPARASGACVVCLADMRDGHGRLLFARGAIPRRRLMGGARPSESAPPGVIGSDHPHEPLSTHELYGGWWLRPSWHGEDDRWGRRDGGY